MKKILVLAMTALMLLSVLSFSSCDKKDGDNSLQKVLDSGKFKLGLDDSFPPMGYRDENNEIVGFDIDLAKEVCKRMGVELELCPIKWESNIMELNSGSIDCLWNGMSINDTRKEQMLLSEPYMKNKMVFMVKKDSGFTKPEDLKGKKVAVQKSSTAQPVLEDFAKETEMEIVTFDDNVMAFMDLKTDGVQALFLDVIVADYMIKNDGSGDYVTMEKALTEEDYAIGFRKNDKTLRDKVQSILEEMKADGKMAEISTKWFGKDVTTIKSK